jgi:uncharacterized coiled-coil DUF342 family protein
MGLPALAQNPQDLDSNLDAEIEFLDAEISKKLTFRHSIVQELKKLNESKAALRKELMTLSERINRGRSEVNHQQTDIMELNNEKRKLKRRVIILKESANELKSHLRAATRNIRLSEGQLLQRKLKDMEWKLQTQKLDRQEEKQIVGYIREIELSLRQWKQAQEISRRLDKQRSEIDALQTRLDEISAITVGVGPEMAKLYEEGDRWMAARRQVIRELDDKRTDIDELVSKLDETNAEISALTESRKAARKELTRQESERNKQAERTYRSKMKSLAQERLTAGKKLTFNEFKLLSEDDN